MSAQFEVNTHAQITRAASGDLLTEDQLSVVVAQNMLVDMDQFNSCLHFDNCAFECGAAQLEQYWSHLDSLPMSTRFETPGLSVLGRLLHTTQDFYAHSNWVELHLDHAAIPLWDGDVATLPAGIVSGTFVLDTPKCCAAAAPSHGDLNKDSPASPSGSKVVEAGPHAGSTLFQIAFATAVAASATQFDRFKGTMLAGDIHALQPQVRAAGTESAITPLVCEMGDRNGLAREHDTPRVGR